MGVLTSFEHESDDVSGSAGLLASMDTFDLLADPTSGPTSGLAVSSTGTDPADLSQAVEALRALRGAVEFAYRAAEGDMVGADHQIHDFEVTFDGDGYNEPYSVYARCFCQKWSSSWCQSDPPQTGRPEVGDLLVAWTDHVDSTTPAVDATF